MPHYMFKDMRKKGKIVFTLKVRSNVNQFIVEKQKLN